MKRIGLSLPFAYLTGRTDNVFHHEFGPLSSCLKQFRDKGAQSVEMRVLSPQADPKAALDAAKRIWDEGLGISIHGLLPAAPIHDDLSTLYPALHVLAEPLAHRQAIAMVALHAYQSSQEEASTLADESVDSLSRLAKLCEQQALPFVFAVELNRSKKVIDPADNCPGVEAIRQRVGHPRLGICWDFGHGYVNYLHQLGPASPPQSFVERVTHTHIHDVGPTGKTHWPLTEAKLPINTYTRLLESVGYQGLWNLELSPDRYQKEDGIASRILQSIETLASA
jgi:sugar phosphate isomerase/epimerase